MASEDSPQGAELLRFKDVALDPTRIIAIVASPQGARLMIHLEGGSCLQVNDSAADDFRAWLNGPQEIVRLRDATGLASDPGRREEFGLPAKG